MFLGVGCGVGVLCSQSHYWGHRKKKLISLQSTSLTFARIGWPMEVAIVRLKKAYNISSSSTFSKSKLLRLHVEVAVVRFPRPRLNISSSSTLLVTLLHLSIFLSPNPQEGVQKIPRLLNIQPSPFIFNRKILHQTPDVLPQFME